MTISITPPLHRNKNRRSSRLRKLSKVTASKWKNCDSDPGGLVLKFMLLITLLQMLSLKMDFSNTDTFSHPISYYPGVRVFTENNVTRREKQHWAGKNNTWPPEENNKLVIIKPVFHARHFHIYHPSCYVISVPYESILHPSLPGTPDICPWMGHNLSPLPSGFCWAQWLRNRSKGGVKRQLI